jgi:phospholipid/cholesterol/gamma-HCH transport system substrate-binding protein
MDRKKIRDTLVGIFVVIGVIFFIILYTWLNGKIVMRNTRDVTVYYSDVGGLRIGDPVMVFGLEKGKIKSLHIEGGRVRTVLSVSRDIPLPEDSRFALRSGSLLGGDRYVKITPGTSSVAGSVFEGEVESLDLESIAGELSRVVKMIEGIKFPDLSNVGEQLTRAIDKSIKDLSQTFQQPGNQLNSLILRLDSISILLKGDGTIGKLIKSDELYEEMRSTARSLKDLSDDLRNNPKKYLDLKDIKIKVF